MDEFSIVGMPRKVEIEFISMMGVQQAIWLDGKCQKCGCVCIIELLPENQEWGLVMCTRCEWNGVTKHKDVA